MSVTCLVLQYEVMQMERVGS